METFIERYHEIRDQVDVVCNKLHLKHSAHTKCNKGCSYCCMDFSILPIEYYSILSEIKARGNVETNKSDEGCLFLVNQQCSIYESRPLICRSHGLPIFNMDSDGENWELMTCPLNFEDVDSDYFTLDEGFVQDVFNSKLYLLNYEFVKKAGIVYSENDLLEIRGMKQELNETNMLLEYY